MLRAEYHQKAGDAAERATRKEFEADRTCWWQSGRREQFQAEAADCAYAKVAELARYGAELQRELGGPGIWRQARQHLERAEASYVQDRQLAHDADHLELNRLRGRVAGHDTTAVDASTPTRRVAGTSQLGGIPR